MAKTVAVRNSIVKLNLLQNQKYTDLAYLNRLLVILVNNLWPLLQTWIINYIYYKEWDDIAYLFLNFNGATVGYGDGKLVAISKRVWNSIKE